MKNTSVIWPDIPYPSWQKTCSALHLFTQIVGKYRLAHTPWINHSWHATIYVNACGLTTGLIPDGPGITVQFDLQSQRLLATCAHGEAQSMNIEPMSVAAFNEKFRGMISSLGGTPEFHHSPNELPEAVPFNQDLDKRPWDAEAVSRFHRALVKINGVFNTFRTGFLGKVGPVHLFWGSFDLAVTRFSGRSATLHPGGIPNLPDAVTQEAYSHEVSSAGFWPGGGGIDEPCFYSYAYPSPDGFANATVKPEAAKFDTTLGEFVLPYEAVRNTQNPEETLMSFLQSSYEAAATLGAWSRSDLECSIGIPGIPRSV